MRLVAGLVLTLLPTAAPAQFNVTFDPSVVILPVHWNGAPAFMLGVPRGANWRFVTFYDPGLQGPYNVQLNVELLGVIDGRPCVDDPTLPMEVNYGCYESLQPWFRVRRGVNLYTASVRPLRYYYAGIEPNYAGVRSLWWDGSIRSACSPLEPEIIFFIVTPEIL